MNKFLKGILRNFLLITLAIIVIAIILQRSDRARSAVLPHGVSLPPGAIEPSLDRVPQQPR